MQRQNKSSFQFIKPTTRMLLEYLHEHLISLKNLVKSWTLCSGMSALEKRIYILDWKLFRRGLSYRKGLERIYYLKDDKDLTYLFLSEKSFLNSIECVFHNRPAPYGWGALETAKYELRPTKNSGRFFSRCPEWICSSAID